MSLNRCFDFLLHQNEAYPLEDCLAYKEDGHWKKHSTGKVIETVNRLSFGLLSRGIKKGDKISIISENRPEWLIVDLAIQQIGAVSVPLYPNAVSKDYEYAFNHAEVKMVFFSGLEIGKKIDVACGDKLDIKSFSFEKLSSYLH